MCVRVARRMGRSPHILCGFTLYGFTRHDLLVVYRGSGIVLPFTDHGCGFAIAKHFAKVLASLCIALCLRYAVPLLLVLLCFVPRPLCGAAYLADSRLRRIYACNAPSSWDVGELLTCASGPV